VLDNADGPSSLATSISTTGELLKGRINATAAKGVCWGSHSVMVATVLHFAALRSELELLGSGRTTDLTEDQADALWTRVHTASDLMESYVPSSIAHFPPDGMGE
jgi:hypothetical protein